MVRPFSQSLRCSLENLQCCTDRNSDLLLSTALRQFWQKLQPPVLHTQIREYSENLPSRSSQALSGWIMRSGGYFRLDQVAFSLMLPPSCFIVGTLLSRWWSDFWFSTKGDNDNWGQKDHIFAPSDQIILFLTACESFRCFLANISQNVHSSRFYGSDSEYSGTFHHLHTGSLELSQGLPLVSWLHLLQRSPPPPIVQPALSHGCSKSFRMMRPLCSWEPSVKQKCSFFISFLNATPFMSSGDSFLTLWLILTHHRWERVFVYMYTHTVQLREMEEPQVWGSSVTSKGLNMNVRAYVSLLELIKISLHVKSNQYKCCTKYPSVRSEKDNAVLIFSQFVWNLKVQNVSLHFCTLLILQSVKSQRSKV